MPYSTVRTLSLSCPSCAGNSVDLLLPLSISYCYYLLAWMSLDQSICSYQKKKKKKKLHKQRSSPGRVTFFLLLLLLSGSVYHSRVTNESEERGQLLSLIGSITPRACMHSFVFQTHFSPVLLTTQQVRVYGGHDFIDYYSIASQRKYNLAEYSNIVLSVFYDYPARQSLFANTD